MKMRAALLALLAGANAGADPVVVIYRPVPTATVISPLTPPVAQANQSLLNQINSTLVQRRTEHEIATTSAVLRAQAVFVPNRPGR